jgi:hypothetical protein
MIRLVYEHALTYYHSVINPHSVSSSSYNDSDMPSKYHLISWHLKHLRRSFIRYRKGHRPGMR